MNPRYTRWRWITFSITWLIYAGFYLTRQSFSVAKTSILYDSRVALSRAGLGAIDSTYLTLYMLGQFFFGPMGDRFGPRRILLFGLTLSVAAGLGFGWSTALVSFFAFSVLQGIAQSTGWSGVNKAMSSWFSVNERGRVLGIWCTHYTVGPFIATNFAGWMTSHFTKPDLGSSIPTFSSLSAMVSPYAPALFTTTNTFVATVPDWSAAFWGPALALLVITLLAALIMRNKPEDVGLPPIEEYHRDGEVLSSDDKAIVETSEGSWDLIRTVLATPRIWPLAIAYFSVKLVRYVFIFWGPLYVAEAVHSGPLASASVSSIMPFGGLVGAIAAGFISDKIFQSRRAPVAVISLIACASLMIVGFYQIHNIWIVAAFFFLVGMTLFGPDSIISSTASIDFGTRRGAGTAVGFVNGVGSIGGILGGWLPGKITTGTNWTPLFVVMLVGLVVSSLVLVPLWNVKSTTE